MANRQYLTPPDIPDDVYCRVLRIPNSPQWVGTLTGVLYPLCFASAWTDEDGGITPEVAAERFTQLFNEFLEGDGICDMGMFDVRQNETEPCILEKTDDGLVWQPFAMLNLCVPLQPKPDTRLPSLIRHNDVTDTIEYSLDGGETWVEAIPPVVPETNPWTPPRIPAEGSTDHLKRCNAANRAVGNLNDMYKQTYGAIAAGIANTLTDFSKFMAELADVVFSVTYGYWYTIPDLLLDYWFGPEVYNYYTAPELPLATQEDLLCLLYQYASVSDDGVVSFDFEAVRDNVIDVLGINPGIAVWSHLNYLGEAGLNRLGDIGFGAGLSCDSCLPEWCYTASDTFDGVAPEWAAGMVTSGSITFVNNPAQWFVSGGMLQTTPTANATHLVGAIFPEVVDLYEWHLNWIFNNGGGNPHTYIGYLDENGNNVILHSGFTPANSSTTRNGNGVKAKGIFAGYYAGGGTPSNAKLENISFTVRGRGENPFGEDNC